MIRTPQPLDVDEDEPLDCEPYLTDEEEELLDAWLDGQLSARQRAAIRWGMVG